MGSCTLGFLRDHLQRLPSRKTGTSRRRDPREVCPLSRGVMWPRPNFFPKGSGPVGAKRNPYSLDYGATFAFSLVPYPPSHRPFLRLAVPPVGGKKTGLPRFTERTTIGLGALCPPIPIYRDGAVWLGPISSFGPFRITTVQTSVQISSPCRSPWLPYRALLAVMSSPCGPDTP